jgi:hypothetical protein
MDVLDLLDTNGDVPIIPHAHSGNPRPQPREWTLTCYDRELGRQWAWACLQELRHRAPVDGT